ncbi:MAG: CHAD domain-containing protein [Verrucomicrobia bacterium]|jgi:CHAD domain-containing protein|nr:CHAD domain-containing protein [Verrucomicrobiota bacterium]
MKPAKLHRRWQQQCRRLLGELDELTRACRAGGNAEQIHRLRVTLRRVRLFLRVGRPLLDGEELERFRAWARVTARLTGRIRDSDVAIEWVAPKADARDLAELLMARRERRWRATRSRLRSLPREWIAGLQLVKTGKSAARRLQTRCEKMEKRLREAVRSQIFTYEKMSAAEQHEFRRRIRWWRYLRELTLGRRRQASDKLLARLVAVQEAIGERQNGEVTRQALEPMKPDALVLSLRRSLTREKATRDSEIRASLAALIEWMGWTPPVQPPPEP